MKKVIITGVTGQDGSYMADYLLTNTNCEVYGMVRRTSKPDYSNLVLAKENSRFHFVTGDLADSNSIENLVREIQPDYFINFAAQSFVGASWQIPEQTFDIAATSIIRILEAIYKFAPTCRFYSAGSSEEMGDVLYAPQDLNHPKRPRSQYGAGKAAAGFLTKVYRESYNLYAIHCILYNHESERRGEEFVTRKITKGVARIFHSIQKDDEFAPIELGNLDSKRDWSHAQDFVEAVWLMLNQDKPKEYLLSSNETHSIREFVEKAFAAANIHGMWFINPQNDPKSEQFVLLDENGRPSTGKALVVVNPKFYRPAEVELLWGDSSLARKELNWKPKISFDELVKRMVICDIDETWKTTS